MSNEKIVVDVVQDKDGVFKALPGGSAAALPNKVMTVGEIPREETSGFRWAPWGGNDLLPTEIRRKLEEVPMAMSAVDKLVKMMYGNGLTYFKDSDLQDGNTEVTRAYVPEVEYFLKANRIQYWLMQQCADYRLYMNAFSEIIFSKDRSKVVNIYPKQAEFCRLAKQNEKTLNIDTLYYSPRFANGLLPSDEQIVEMPLFVWHDEERFLAKMKGYKMAWHSHFPTPGMMYYAKPFWIGLFKKDGWLDVSANVPRIVSAMQNNQVSLKYQICIPESYFTLRHPDWNNYTAEMRQKLTDDKIAELNQYLTGTENVYKSIAYVFKDDNVNDRSTGKIEVIAVDDKVKEDKWVPDSNAADAQIVQGLGLHPSQIGLQPAGGKMGAGSGSDQRESYNTQISLNTMEQAILLEPLNWIARYNKWGVTFMIDHTTHTTTNAQESGLQPSSTTIKMK